MIQLTERASQQIVLLKKEEEESDIALRIAIQGKGKTDFDYAIGFVLSNDFDEAEDVLQDSEGIQILVDKKSFVSLDGSTVDFVEEEGHSGFKIENPNSLWKDPIEEKIHLILHEKIGPAVQSHGGWVDLVEVKEDVAYVRFSGGCQGCGMANVTLKQGVETMIKYEVPEIARVVDITEHEKGESPFFE